MKKNGGSKRKILIALVLVLIIVFVIVVFLLINKYGTKSLTCTRSDDISDFKMEEILVIDVKEDVIKKLDLEKAVTIGETYNRFDQYDETMLSQFENAYKYLDKDLYKIKQKDHKTSVKVTLEESGLILDNITIRVNNPDNKMDVMFNTVNNLESSSTTYKVGDKYTIKELTKKIEDLGYKCD